MSDDAAVINNLTGMIRMLAAERQRALAERDAARDLAARLKGMLGRVESLHHGWSHTCLADDGSEELFKFYPYSQPCPTYRLAHGTDQ